MQETLNIQHRTPNVEVIDGRGKVWDLASWVWWPRFSVSPPDVSDCAGHAEAWTPNGTGQLVASLATPKHSEGGWRKKGLNPRPAGDVHPGRRPAMCWLPGV